jgi:hypothetical protein
MYDRLNTISMLRRAGAAWSLEVGNEEEIQRHTPFANRVGLPSLRKAFLSSGLRL